MSTKYQLETIPVWDALNSGSECLLCDLEEESERRNTEFFLGSSIMAPEMRVEVNAHGFCPRHFHVLLAGTGKLGYSLALNTHREAVLDRFRSYGRKLVGSADKRGVAIRAAESLSEMLVALERDCLMCDRIHHNLANYSYTIVKLFETDAGFREAWAGSRGVCLHHLPRLLEMGSSVLAGRIQVEWNAMLVELEERSLERLGEELEQFSWQFDYQSDLKTPDHAQDSVARVVQKLAGYGPQRTP